MAGAVAGGVAGAVVESQHRGARTAERAEVLLAVPADSIYLSVVRTAAAGLAARLDFTLDDIEDLRIAVDEACALLLKQARTDTQLRISFSLDGNALRARVSATCERPILPPPDGFSWTVLSALTSSLDMSVDGHELSILLTRARGHDG